MYLITFGSISIILNIFSMNTINNIHSINGISNINSAIRLHNFNSFFSFNHFSVGKSISPSSYEERAQAAFDSVEVLWDAKKNLQGTGASTSLKLIAYLVFCFGQEKGILIRSEEFEEKRKIYLLNNIHLILHRAYYTWRNMPDEKKNK